MDCYKCKYRGGVVGSAHSSCGVIKSTGDEKAGALELLIATGKYVLTDDEDKPLVDLDPHGVRNGWAMWPINFDPTWVRSCEFFTLKEEVKEHGV